MFRSLGCMRLNTAGVIIGWTSTTISVMSVIVFTLGLVHLNYLTESIFAHMREPNIKEENVASGLIIVLTIYITLNMLNLVASALLVAGTIREHHLMLLPWLIFNGISMFVSLIYFIYYVATQKSNHIAPITLFSSGLSVVIQFFWWYVILSLYKKIQEEREIQLLIGSSISIHASHTNI